MRAKTRGVAPPTYRVRTIRGRQVAVVAFRDRTTGQRREFWLGLADSPEARARYARLLLTYERAGGRLPARRQLAAEIQAPTVAILVRDFLAAASARVSPSMQALYGMALGLLLARYADVHAADLRPAHLRELQAAALAGDAAAGRKPWTRQTANRAIRLIVTAYRWAVTHELVPVTVYELLRAVEPLRPTPTEAHDVVGPVDPKLVDETLPHVPEPVAFLARFQLLTGARPGEACSLRPCDIRMEKRGPWSYRPPAHKNLWRGRGREILIGPQAQAMLADWLKDCLTTRTVAVTATGQPYTVALYRRAIARACERENLAHWHPNQLRHTYATAVRAAYGLEAAQIALGHAHANITEVYAERDVARLRKIVAKIG